MALNKPPILKLIYLVNTAFVLFQVTPQLAAFLPGFVSESPTTKQATIVDALGNLSNQLDTLHHSMTSFPSQFALPKEIRILDNTINTKAPSLENIKKFAHETGIEIVQLVVVWQDLSLGAFLGKEDKIIRELEWSFAGEAGIKVPEMVTYFRESNKELKDKLEKITDATSNLLSIGGGSASCGYHALAHLQTLDKFFASTTSVLSNLIDLKHINRYFGLTEINTILNRIPLELRESPYPVPGEWRELIRSMQAAQHKKAINDLQGIYPQIKSEEELKKWLKDEKAQKNNQDIWKTLQSKYAAYSTQNGEWLTDSGMTYLDNNVDSLKNINYHFWSTGILDLERKLALESLTNKGYIAFLVNSENKHWYGTYIKPSLKKTNSIMCIIVDSKNQSRYDDKLTINMLIALFPEKSSVIEANKGLLSTRTIPEEQRIMNLRVIAPLEEPSILKEAFRPISLSSAELIFILNNFAYFEIIKNILKQEDLITIYKKLKDKELLGENSLATHIQSLLKYSKGEADTIARVLSRVFSD